MRTKRPAKLPIYGQRQVDTVALKSRPGDRFVYLSCYTDFARPLVQRDLHEGEVFKGKVWFEEEPISEEEAALAFSYKRGGGNMIGKGIVKMATSEKAQIVTLHAILLIAVNLVFLTWVPVPPIIQASVNVAMGFLMMGAMIAHGLANAAAIEKGLEGPKVTP